MYIPHMRGSRGVAILPAIVLAAVFGTIALGLSALQSETNTQTLTASVGDSATSPTATTGGKTAQCKAGYAYVISIAGTSPKIQEQQVIDCTDSNNKDKEQQICYTPSACATVSCPKKQGAEFYTIDNKGGPQVTGRTCIEGEEVKPQTSGTGGAGGMPQPPASSPDQKQQQADCLNSGGMISGSGCTAKTACGSQSCADAEAQQRQTQMDCLTGGNLWNTSTNSCGGTTPPANQPPQTCPNGGTPPDCTQTPPPQTCPNGGTPPSCTAPAQPCPNGQGTQPYCGPDTKTEQCQGISCLTDGKNLPKMPSFGGGGSGGGSSGGGNSNGTLGGSGGCSLISSLFGCTSQVSCQISANPTQIQQGLPATLTWSATGNLSGANITGIGSVPPSSTYTIYPTATTNYVMSVSDQSGNVQSCNATVTVAPKNASCPAVPQQPLASQCSAGSWQPQYSSVSGANCITSWQCVASGSGGPTAQISCQPSIADVGMSLAISYACGGNANQSGGSGFFTLNQLSGSTSTIVGTPPTGTNTANYGLTCSNGSQTVTQQCQVQVNQPSITLVARPSHVNAGDTSVIGWVTSGMSACIVSSPDQTDFTTRNASNQSVNGTATTSAITATSTAFRLHCTTLAGGTRDAVTSVVIGNTNTAQDINISSTADGATINHGDTVKITWSLINPIANSAMSLWLIDLDTEEAVALIAGQRGAKDSYTWKLPNTSDACDTNSPLVCASDMVAGHSYGIQAALYTPQNAFLGGLPVPANAVDPTYVDIGYTPVPFTLGQ